MNQEVGTKNLDYESINSKIKYSTLTELDKELPYHLVGVSLDFYQFHLDRPFGYTAYQWIQTVSGSGTLIAGGKKYCVSENQGMLLYRDEPHEYWDPDGPWITHWITFNGLNIEKMLHKFGFDTTKVLTLSNVHVLESIIRKAYQLLDTNAPHSGLYGSAMIYQLLIELYLGVYENQKKQSGESRLRLQPVFDYIENHLNCTLSIEELAALIGITSAHFCVLFKEISGHRPVDYINSRRIEVAKSLLIGSPEMRINQISKKVGFVNNSYFSKIFRKYEGISPHEYRRLSKLR